MRLHTTWADWLYDLRRLVHHPVPTISSVIVRAFAQPVVLLTITGRKTNRCMRSKNSVFHQTFTIGCMYFKSTEIARPKIVRSGVTIA